ncbi:transposase [Fusobacterium sp. THCT1E2]
MKIGRLIKKTLTFNSKLKTKRIKQRITDPKCGVVHKGEHKKVFSYFVNTACDKNNFVLDFVLNSGSTYDSTVFPKLYDKIKKHYSGIKCIVVDAGYKIPVMPFKRPMTKKEFFKKKDYIFDECFNYYLCSNDKILKYITTNIEGYREYKSNAGDCKIAY